MREPESVSGNAAFDQMATTGSYVVLFEEGAQEAVSGILHDRTGVSTTSTEDAQALPEVRGLEEAIIFPQLGCAVMQLEPAQIHSLGVDQEKGTPILAIEPERKVFALETRIRTGLPVGASGGVALSAEYLRGYRDALNNLLGSTPSASMPVPGSTLVLDVDESQTTWGLQATSVVNSSFSGRGIRVAILDTGMDLTHPDFAGRSITPQSFIQGENAQDGHGHGTHCIGTATGAITPGTLPRYGVAYQAQIFAGKVLSDQGSGADRGILAGIDWAIRNECRVISMSLGAPAWPGQTYSKIFEAVARRALRRGVLIVAAAGNESRRDTGVINSVGHPANCPSIMAVGAVDLNMQIARFSNRGINPEGGQVDIAGPGVDVLSSWPMPTGYRTISGTSMATPHVAGIATLLCQANTEISGEGLWSLLIQSARRLPLPSVDAGAGLVQAPIAAS